MKLINIKFSDGSTRSSGLVGLGTSLSKGCSYTWSCSTVESSCTICVSPAIRWSSSSETLLPPIYCWPAYARMRPYISNTLLCFIIWLILSVMLCITVAYCRTNVVFSFMSAMIWPSMSCSDVLSLVASYLRLYSNWSRSEAGLNSIFNFSPSFIRNLQWTSF